MVVALLSGVHTLLPTSAGALKTAVVSPCSTTTMRAPGSMLTVSQPGWPNGLKAVGLPAQRKPAVVVWAMWASHELRPFQDIRRQPDLVKKKVRLERFPVSVCREGRRWVISQPCSWEVSSSDKTFL